MVYRYTVEIDYPQSGGPGYNIWHYRALTDQDQQDLIDAIDNFYGLLSNFYPAGTVITGPSESTSGIEGSSPTYTQVTGFTRTSTGSAVSISPALQAVVGWRTDSATRSGRGRTFVGALNDSTSEDNGSLSGSFLSALQQAGQSVVTFNGGFGNGAIGVWSPTDGLLRDITGSRVRDQFAVLRSRRD